MIEIGPPTGVIDGDGMFPPLLKACPSFRPAWEAHCRQYADEPGPMHYLALSDLARHLVGLLEKGQTGCFPAVFEVVERWHVEGDDYVQNAATVGLLEDLQNTGIHEATTPEQFVPWLGPVSLQGWRSVENFWNGLTASETDSSTNPSSEPQDP